MLLPLHRFYYVQHMANISYADPDIRQQNTAVPVLTLERMQTLLQLPVDTAIDRAAVDLLARMLAVNPNDRISIRYFIHIQYVARCLLRSACLIV
jgi:hypothetical protein